MSDNRFQIFNANLIQADENISIEAKYASRFSLAIRPNNGYDLRHGSEFILK